VNSTWLVPASVFSGQRERGPPACVRACGVACSTSAGISCEFHMVGVCLCFQELGNFQRAEGSCWFSYLCCVRYLLLSSSGYVRRGAASAGCGLCCCSRVALVIVLFSVKRAFSRSGFACSRVCCVWVGAWLVGAFQRMRWVLSMSDGLRPFGLAGARVFLNGPFQV
jgi:hypothetical protein